MPRRAAAETECAAAAAASSSASRPGDSDRDRDPGAAVMRSSSGRPGKTAVSNGLRDGRDGPPGRSVRRIGWSTRETGVWLAGLPLR